MTTHTPGPWVVHTHRDGHIVIAAHNEDSPDIALGYIPIDIGAPPEIRLENATVMALAPDMVNIINELVERIENSNTSVPTNLHKKISAILTQVQGC